MSIKIDKTKCVGCQKCKQVCPGNLIRLDKQGKAEIHYAEECWGCASCLKECQHNAIRYYLGADMGGNGTLLYVKDNETTIEWVIDKGDGTTESIIINKSNSNSY